MRSDEEYRRAVRLIEGGINDSQVSRLLGIPRETIREWRLARQAGSNRRTRHSIGLRLDRCSRCGKGFVDDEAYAYLLGAYLGDGCLSRTPREVYRLRIVCDVKYPDIINQIASCVVIARGSEKVGFVKKIGCVEVYSYWKHWPCLFPQHGPGRKHERKIGLAPWQQLVVADHPKALIRGLIHSDGNRHINEVTRRLPSGPRRYRYPRYMFTNASTDILGIFTDALDSLEVQWTQTTARDISIARKGDVAFLDTFIGPKS
jgi:hypothetical protein